MKFEDAVWAGLLLAGTAFERRAIRNGDGTLSGATQRLFRTRTRVGKVAFAATWVTFASWYTHHIITGEWS